MRTSTSGLLVTLVSLATVGCSTAERWDSDAAPRLQTWMKKKVVVTWHTRTEKEQEDSATRVEAKFCLELVNLLRADPRSKEHGVEFVSGGAIANDDLVASKLREHRAGAALDLTCGFAQGGKGRWVGGGTVTHYDKVGEERRGGSTYDVYSVRKERADSAIVDADQYTSTFGHLRGKVRYLDPATGRAFLFGGDFHYSASQSFTFSQSSLSDSDLQVLRADMADLLLDDLFASGEDTLPEPTATPPPTSPTVKPADAPPPRPTRAKLASEQLRNDVVLEAIANGENPNLARGYSGEHVRRIQLRLVKLGLPIRDDQPGNFGDGTRDAVLDFQARKKLPENGQVDRATILALDEER